MTRNTFYALITLVAGFLAALAVHAQEFKPIFDGKTLKGWHLQGEGSWRVDSGVIIGTHTATGPDFGHLVSDSEYVDFTLRFKWKLVKGNSGLYYHSAEGGEAGMIGPQVEMDGAYPGGIYTTNTNPWGWVVQPKVEDVKTWWKPNDWNLVTVAAVGKKVTVTYNGIKTAESSDARLPQKGRLGFQVHANQECDIRIKDVELALPVTVGLRGDVSGRKGAYPRAWRDPVDIKGRHLTTRTSAAAVPVAGLKR